VTDDALFILAVLAANVAVSEWLVRRTVARHLGTALLVIVITAVTANLGLIPTGSAPVPLYGGIFSEVAHLSIFLLLLRVSLADVRRAGPAMLGLFLVGAAGTFGGVLAGLALVDGAGALGDLEPAVGGMFVGTYTGGSLNFNAVALHYGVVEEGALYTGAVAVDSIMTAAWMVATIALPRLLAPLWPDAARVDLPRPVVDDGGVDDDTETAHPLDLAVLLGLAAGAWWLSGVVADAVEARGVESFPAVVVLTTVALALAQLPWVRRLRGARMAGMVGIYLFLATIGAHCDLEALGELGTLGGTLFLFVTATVAVHGAVIFGAARLLRVEPSVAAVASQANIGGGTSALALARSLGRPDLVLPGILVGALGTAIGTYLGFLASGLL